MCVTEFYNNKTKWGGVMEQCGVVGVKGGGGRRSERPVQQRFDLTDC